MIQDIKELFITASNIRFDNVPSNEDLADFSLWNEENDLNG